ncbi:NirD/YgiW/YdeI family stress tolerance protein [Pleurocapsa sp. PCC 7319]|uniref:NirD/YgiW/YdeI family stress tolerance protein n=1 Tax=Pleurocapsa sp. PCC 7319 TaxID=118161 RepID=UPI0003653A34|nr:NirD/YgiW/YdeI family stress tolerance protein [Pleurocapsa sp. PCC 7319]
MIRSIQKINTVFALIAINSLVCANAWSQTKIETVSSVLDNPIDGKEVTLQGKIIEKMSDEADSNGTDYIFTDGTNEITVELQDANYPYDQDTMLEISGIIDFESEHLEEKEKDLTPEDIQIKVNQLQVVNLNKSLSR